MHMRNIQAMNENDPRKKSTISIAKYEQNDLDAMIKLLLSEAEKRLK